VSDEMVAGCGCIIDSKAVVLLGVKSIDEMGVLVVLVKYRFTNPRCQVMVISEFCMVAHNICGSSVQNSFHVTSPVLRILIWLLDFWKICLLVF
jgi:hypothetical protein